MVKPLATNSSKASVPHLLYNGAKPWGRKHAEYSTSSLRIFNFSNVYNLLSFLACDIVIMGSRNTIVNQ